jgi:hypothetical protein
MKINILEGGQRDSIWLPVKKYILNDHVSVYKKTMPPSPDEAKND